MASVTSLSAPVGEKGNDATEVDGSIETVVTSSTLSGNDASVHIHTEGGGNGDAYENENPNGSDATANVEMPIVAVDPLDADSDLLMDQLDELGDAFDGFEDIIFAAVDTNTNANAIANTNANADASAGASGNTIHAAHPSVDGVLSFSSNSSSLQFAAPSSSSSSVSSAIATYDESDGMSAEMDQQKVLVDPLHFTSSNDHQKRKLDVSHAVGYETHLKVPRHDFQADVASNRRGDLQQMENDLNAVEVVPPASLSLNRSVMKQLLIQLVGPLSASVKPFPSSVLDSLVEIARLGMEELIGEASIIREEIKNGKESAAVLRQQLNQTPPQFNPTFATSRGTHTMSLTPSMIREAYRRLLNGGRLPSRSQAGIGLFQARSSSSAGVSAVSGTAGPIMQPIATASILANSADDPHIMYNQLKKQRAWRR